MQEALSVDLGASVADAAWAPHASTMFAAATESGKILVFDLEFSFFTPICKQKVVDGSLTKISFNPVHPILLAGDDR